MIDTAIIPYPRDSEDLREYMDLPWSSRFFPRANRYLFPAPQGVPPFGEWQASARVRDGASVAADGTPNGSASMQLGQESTALPASDPAIVRDHLVAIGADRAVLLPLTRGLIPDVDLASIICSATNDWLADAWLGSGNEDRRFLGSIRLNPRDPARAVTEIERWAGDERMVQVALPLEAHAPYGQRAYLPLWEAVAAADLPVAIRSDGGAGMDFAPTVNGYPHVFAEYASLVPMNYIYHLTSLIAEGTFERFPNLRFVFTDGGHDVLMPLMWRMDMDWPITKSETPLVKRLPSEYLNDHVRFVTSRLEGPPDEETLEGWGRRSNRAQLTMFGSQYPQWNGMTPGEWRGIADSDERDLVFSENACRFYRLGPKESSETGGAANSHPERVS